jgi:hypothetical protein
MQLGKGPEHANPVIGCSLTLVDIVAWAVSQWFLGPTQSVPVAMITMRRSFGVISRFKVSAAKRIVVVMIFFDAVGEIRGIGPPVNCSGI